MLFNSCAYVTPKVSQAKRKLQICMPISRPKEAYLVRVDWMDLELAFRDNTGTESFLDRSTGEVLSIVPGFDDEDDLRRQVELEVGRYVQITPVSISYSKEVMRAFIPTLDASSFSDKEQHQALKETLKKTVGFLTQSLEVLRTESRALARYHRFEQQRFWEHVQAFLDDKSVVPDSAPPAPELFEELSRFA